MFIQRDAETGELVVFDVSGDGAAGFMAEHCSISGSIPPRDGGRPSARSRPARPGSLPGDMLRELCSGPGAAIAALLIEHRRAGALEDAVARTGGAPLVKR